MFERYAETARRCIFFAQRSATQTGSQTIETEHLLLGILREDPDVISRFLPSKTANEIRAEVEKRIAKRNVSTSIDIPLSPHCQRILTYTAEEAVKSGHRHIDVGHLLIGVVREEGGVAGQILRSAGLNVAAMRERMRLNDAAQ